MSFPINFQEKGTYRSLDAGITIAAILRYGILEAFCEAKIDTGAEACLFERGIAKDLGVDVESGYRESFSTLTGRITAYAHEVELETLSLRFQSYVYFAESREVKRNLLGRRGWLQPLAATASDRRNRFSLAAARIDGRSTRR